MIRFFISQSKALNLFVLLVMVFGVFTFITGQKDGFPNIGSDRITISTSYSGVSADEIKTLITEKIEKAVQNIAGKEEIRSYSVEGSSVVIFEVDSSAGFESKKVLKDIKSAVDIEKKNLPLDADEPNVRQIQFSRSVVNMVIGFVSSGSTEELRRIVDIFEQDAKKISGVGRVEKSGYAEAEIRVTLIPSKMQEFNIQIEQVSLALAANNISLPAGKFFLGDEEFFLKTTKQYASVSDIENTVIQANDNGNFIRLNHVAELSLSYQEQSVIRRSYGKEGIWVSIYKLETGDTIRISKEIRALLERYRHAHLNLLPKYVDIVYSSDLSFYVKRRLQVLTSNATVGLFLVFLCLILFYDYRISLWTLLGIPFSLCLAVLIMYAIGLTLNLITMFGFIIVIGMVVDDAIVVSENIYARVEKGETFYEAAASGTSEILIPVFAMIATTILAFLPLITLPGTLGKVLSFIPLVVCITLLCSLVECVFILPGHLAHIKDRKQQLPQSSLASASKTKKIRGWFQYVLVFYTNFMRNMLKKPLLSYGLFCILMLSATWLLRSRISFVFFPSTTESILVDLVTKTGNSLLDTTLIVDAAEEKVRTSSGEYVLEIISTVGRDGGSHYGRRSQNQSHLGNLRINLDTKRKISNKEIIRNVEDSLSNIPGLLRAEVRQRRGGPHVGSAAEIFVFAQDINTMIKAAKAVEVFLAELKNLGSVTSSYRLGQQELIVQPEEHTLAVLGIDVYSIASTVKNVFSGSEATVINSLPYDGYLHDDVSVFVEYPSNKESENTASLLETEVLAKTGNAIALKNFATLDETRSSSRLTSENSLSYLIISADLEDPKSLEYGSPYLYKALEKQISFFEAEFPGTQYQILGQKSRQDELNTSSLRALFLALFGIYFVLTILFRSFIQPLIIMSIIPFAFMGIIIALALNKVSLGLMPFLGAIALTGIVVNDSLVMLYKINSLRAEGKELLEATLEGASLRFRAIVMTSITTIVGVFPLAYGILGKEPFLAPMAITIVWGLAASTFLLLFMLPTLYVLVEKARLALKSIIA